MTAISEIRRAFADVSHGQIHYRTVGEGAPIVLLHASPGSSKQIARMIGDLASQGRIIAPDTAGNGDSTPLPLGTPSIVDLAAVVLEFLDVMKLDRVKLYGSHTGAAIAAELAILAPERVERLVLDGVQVLTAAQREEVLRLYAHPFPADLEGAYLIRAFQFCRDQYLFYPWYDRTIAGQRTGGLPSPQDLHNWVVEVLKANESYHLNYRAAFQWQAAERLPLVIPATLMLAAINDPLVEDTRGLTSALCDGRFLELPRFDAPDFAALRKAAMMDFFAMPASAVQ